MPSPGLNFNRENSLRNITQSMQALASFSVKYAWPDARLRLKLLTSPCTASARARPRKSRGPISLVTCVTDNGLTATGGAPSPAPPLPGGSRPARGDQFLANVEESSAFTHVKGSIPPQKRRDEMCYRTINATCRAQNPRGHWRRWRQQAVDGRSGSPQTKSCPSPRCRSPHAFERASPYGCRDMQSR